MATKTARAPTIGALIDALYQARAMRIETERKVDEWKKAEKETRDRIIALLTEQGLDGSKGRVATAAITRKRVPKIVDWDGFWAFCRKDRLGVFVHRRVAQEATMALINDGKAVPGVELETVVDLSVTKAGG